MAATFQTQIQSLQSQLESSNKDKDRNAEELKKQLVSIGETKVNFEVEKNALQGEVDELKRKKSKAESKMKQLEETDGAEIQELEDELEEVKNNNAQRPTIKKPRHLHPFFWGGG